MSKTILAGFWLSLVTIIYTYIGYPILVTILARFRGKPHLQEDIYPNVALIIAAYNEANTIAAKIRNSLSLQYPPDRLAIVVVEDGSDDGTADIAAGFDRIRIYHSDQRLGKAAALARVVSNLHEEIFVFTDADTMLAPDSITLLVRHFADPGVGGVAGEKQVSGGGEGLYWRYESYLKNCDGRISSVMGASGELFAIRREAWHPPADDVIIEDFMISMQLILDGWRLVYEPAAIAKEDPLNSVAADWERRTRNAAGGFQAISRLGKMLEPNRGIIAWQFFSHRVLRWAITPFLLPVVFLLNLLLWQRTFYRILFACQVVIYGIGLEGFRRIQSGEETQYLRRGLFNAVFFFIVANMAAIAGFLRYVRHEQPAQWRKAR